MDITIFKKLGLSEKETIVYLSLLEHGAVSVRNLAKAADLNRGTTYDILKQLMKQGLVVYHHKEKHQYFFAEDPTKLERHLDGRLEELSRLRQTEFLAFIIIL